MKKTVILLLTLLLCTGLLSGCLAVRYSGRDGLDIRMGADDPLEKTQKIEISSAATGELLASFQGEEEIEQFLGELDEDNWHIKDLADMPEDTERECAIAMYQTETVKAGMDPEDAEMIKLCTMYTYRSSNCLTMEFPFASFTFTLADGAAEYLHSFAQ